LERGAAGPWWETVQRLGRFEESVQIAEAAYGKPRELGGLAPDDIRTLVRATAERLETRLSSTNVEDITDHAGQIDPYGRPLFAQVATLDWLAGQSFSTGRDDALRRLLARVDAQTAEHAADFGTARMIRNLRTLATARGGMTVDDYSQALSSHQPPSGLLPGVFDDFRGLSLDELLDGMRPDILGELYVLDRLAAQGVERAAAEALLRLVWQASPDAYHAFVERSVRDHREHPFLADLLGICDWNASPLACARLAADTIPLLRRSDHPVLGWIFARLEAAQVNPGNTGMNEIVATVRFRFANLVFNGGDTQQANELFTNLLATCCPDWRVYAGALNNRGITWSDLGNKDLAVADYTAVIKSVSATDEARACALNNRADIYDEVGKTTLTIADRTTLLGLRETTYDRRYIALARRARTLRKLGEHAAAYRDINAIIATPDIVVEQKMQARLQRSRWLIADGSPRDAIPDLTAVVESARNFDGAPEKALTLLKSLGSST
jgi:tetratricopeptide (TPR) repeat protein